MELHHSMEWMTQYQSIARYEFGYQLRLGRQLDMLTKRQYPSSKFDMLECYMVEW